jgi:hypothetical protein
MFLSILFDLIIVPAFGFELLSYELSALNNAISCHPFSSFVFFNVACYWRIFTFSHFHFF